MGALAVVCCCAGLFALWQQGQQRSATRLPAPRAELRVVPGTSIRVLTDEELLKLFEGRPVALVGSGDQRQFVVLDVLRRSTEQAVN